MSKSSIIYEDHSDLKGRDIVSHPNSTTTSLPISPVPLLSYGIVNAHLYPMETRNSSYCPEGPWGAPLDVSHGIKSFDGVLIFHITSVNIDFD